MWYADGARQRLFLFECKLDACQFKNFKPKALTEEQDIAKWRLHHAASCHGNKDGNRANTGYKPRRRIDPDSIYDIMLQKQRYTQVWHLKPGVEERKKKRKRRGESLPPSTARKWRETDSNNPKRCSYYAHAQHTGKVKVQGLISFDQKQSGLWSHSASELQIFTRLMNESQTIGCLCTHTHSPLNEERAFVWFSSACSWSVALNGSASRVWLCATRHTWLFTPTLKSELHWMYVHRSNAMYSGILELKVTWARCWMQTR